MSRGSSITEKSFDDADAGSPGAATPLAVTEYIRAMAAELGAMAEHAELSLLHYLLDMARLEAEDLIRRYEGYRKPERNRRSQSPHPRRSAP